MTSPILSVLIQSERDTVAARQRARQIARALGFDSQDQTRISTAVSEIARNAFNYASHGKVEYFIEGRSAPQLLIVRVSDSGPGIANLDTILEGRYQSPTGMGLGIIGARRLMDQFQIESVPGRGTTIWLKKLLPKRAPFVKPSDLARISLELAQERPKDAFQELQHQNRELLAALEDIQTRQAELTRLNRELEDTNRGVVALYAELDEQADHLRRADELKSRFLSNMSHEFRSPLNSIMALSGLLLDRLDGDLSGGQEQQVRYVRKAAQDLLELVNDLLDLAKVEAGKAEVKPLEFEVSNLFAALRGMLRPLLLNQAVDLVFEDASDIPPAFTDEGKVSQILRNFLSNALKFTEKGEVRVKAAIYGSDVVFAVSDTGIGIGPENQDVIFREFTQVDHPIQKRVKGTGLGLPLSKRLAALLGGCIRLESELGRGSTFTLQIPLRYQENAPETEGPSGEAWVADRSSLPVLVVEDSPETIIVYKTYLKGSGFQVIPASTTREATVILDNLSPAAIVLDVKLRSEDTWKFLAELKREPRTRNIPILIASTIEDHAKAAHLGADDYLVKPVDRWDLINRLRASQGKKPLNQILIIDDNEQDRYLLRVRLNSPSLSVSEAAGGNEGIRKASESLPNLIILDLEMPDMSGFEVLDHLKSIRSTAGIPVVISTSRVLSEEERTLLEARVVAIVSKESLSLSENTSLYETLNLAGMLSNSE